jgi:hypothetical protein
MARKITVLLGLIVIGIAIYSLITYASMPTYLVMTTGGNFPVSNFFLVDLYTGIALIVVGIAIIFEGIKGED